MQAKCAVSGLKNIAAQNIRGNQVGSALYPLELQLKDMRETLHRERLGESRNAFNQSVAARQHNEKTAGRRRRSDPR